MNKLPKFFSNPNRSEASTYQPYVPQYKVLNREPIIADNIGLGKNLQQNKLSPQVIGGASPSNKFPYQNMIDNNQLQTWSNIDGLCIDHEGNEVEISKSNIIDNNLLAEDSDLKENQFFIFIKNDLIYSGSQLNVENFIQELIFDREISADDIIVMKKIELKIGVFLKE